MGQRTTKYSHTHYEESVGKIQLLPLSYLCSLLESLHTTRCQMLLNTLVGSHRSDRGGDLWVLSNHGICLGLVAESFSLELRHVLLGLIGRKKLGKGVVQEHIGERQLGAHSETFVSQGCLDAAQKPLQEAGRITSTVSRATYIGGTFVEKLCFGLGGGFGAVRNKGTVGSAQLLEVFLHSQNLGCLYVVVAHQTVLRSTEKVNGDGLANVSSPT